jgi:prephenate dehydratase
MMIVEPDYQTQKMQQKQPRRITIQGYKGAFHDIAAQTFFASESIEILETDTFEEVLQRVEDGTADTALMAIENSIYGSIIGNFKLLTNSKLRIVGEIYLRIKQNLLTLPNVKISELKEVYSHPVAIQQCIDFFRAYPNIKLIESVDTALSAKIVAEKGKKKVGAIASSLAAELYGLELAAESIETNKRTYTRFLVLERTDKPRVFSEKENKVSVCFEVSHTIGSLHQVLAALAYNRANLTKIESVPIIGKEWSYLFFTAFVMENPAHYENILTVMQGMTENMRVLGRYQQGNLYE